MNRIIISNGTFSSLLVASIINQNHCNTLSKDSNYFLGYFPKSNSEDKQLNIKFIASLIKIEKSFILSDYLKGYSFDFKQIYDTINNPSIDEIYIPINSRTKEIYKGLVKIYPYSSFILYEEGLMSYIKPIVDSSLRRIMQKTQNYYLFYAEKLEQFFCKNFIDISFNKISNATFIKNIKTINEKYTYSLPVMDEKKKYALVLPQYYYQSNKKKTAKLITQYEESIKEIIDNGYVVLFKDHPKGKIKYSDIIKNKFNKDHFIILETLGILPVEIINYKAKIDMVFSVYSTSLFTFNSIFKIPSYTSDKMLDARIGLFSIYPTLSAIITKNIFPDLKNKHKKESNLLFCKNIILNIIIKMIK